MTKVDLILTGGSVATMNDDFDLFDPGAVAIRAGNIEGVGPAEQIAAAYSADEVVDCGGCAVLPGLINVHTHAPMALLRGLADDLRL
ncbi:MAG: S-adenosylhomocysteine deaminase, partial [Chloroflexi bacterium]|nr:S-adenosylhomocysteine deaminase [Chloroflexota bacterium]